jgi:GDPmannose 4,6-dehydratase
LEAIRILGMEKETRFYQASTSELYGLVQEIPQKETTPFYPRSPYGVAKLYGYWITVNYREAYGMYASNGILFNHESPIRGETFVTRKIARSVARIETGLEDTLYLGNLSAKRDWGHARIMSRACTKYCRRMRLTISCWRPARPARCVNSSNLPSRNSAAASSGGARVSRKPESTGNPARPSFAIDPTYFRPTEVDLLIGDASKARQKLGWEPKTSFAQLVNEMVAGDLAIAKREVANGKDPV